MYFCSKARPSMRTREKKRVPSADFKVVPKTKTLQHQPNTIASCASKVSHCESFFQETKYVCIVCGIPVCNNCSAPVLDEENRGWIAYQSVGYCSTCRPKLPGKSNKNAEKKAPPKFYKGQLMTLVYAFYFATSSCLRQRNQPLNRCEMRSISSCSFQHQCLVLNSKLTKEN